MDKYLEQVKPSYSGYQELHVHTNGSFRDAVNTVADVFDAAEEQGRNAVAITDHGNMTRLFEALKERTKREKKHLSDELRAIAVPEDEIQKILRTMSAFDSLRNPNEKMRQYIELYESAFVQAARKSVQFVPGIEMYEANPGVDNENRWHIIFLAKDWQGMKALFLLCNLAQLNKKNEMPRCTVDTMKLIFGEGKPGHGHVIATSACIGGKIPSTLLARYRLMVKQRELIDEQAKLTVISPEAIADGQKAVEDAKAEIECLMQKKSELKKIAAKKYKAAIRRAEKTLADAVAKSNSGDQLSFENYNAPVAAAQATLDGILAQEKESQEAAAKVPEIEKELKEKKAILEKKKEALASLEKTNAPAMRIQLKIDLLETEIQSIGDSYAQAKAYALEYQEIFGKGNFYIELQNHGIEAEVLIRNQLVQLARETGIPLTAANDVHFKNPQAKRKRDIIAALRYPNLTVSDIAYQEGNSELYFKSTDQMMQLFADIPEAIENTNRIAEQCNVFYTKEMHLPQFVAPDGQTPAQYLRKSAVQNILKKYPDCMSWSKERQTAFKQRLNYELSIIEKMGYSSYISIVEEFIRYAKSNFGTDSVGPGRGSGAGSLVCFLVGITNIDPLKYGLIFERFLNPERVSMPDIDTDFAPSIRDKVIAHVAERYAYQDAYPVEELRGTVCAIATEGVLAAKSAIRQVGKVTGVSLSVCDKIAKLVPTTVGMTLKKALEESSDLAQLYSNNAEAKSLLDDAMLVEGTPVQTGVHAAGIIIADKPLSEYAPLYWSDDANTWVIQYDMVSCESDIGLLKMDFLALRNLDIIMRCKDFIRKVKNKEVDSFAVEQADDEEVIAAIYGKGDTDGVFQFESGGMKKTLRSFVPQQIEDVILLNAAYRPGPMQYIPQVTDVKFKRSKPHYVVPEMASILEATYGSPIFQEQIQQIFHEIAGFSLGQADIIRRAMSKKHLDELEAAKDGFVTGLKAKGADEAEIEKFWNELLDFAKYAFNKSHAAAYSVLSYYTAWLKHYYPTEYIAALMSFTQKEDIAPYVKDAKDYEIKVLPPDVNKSIIYTAPTRNGEIRFGLEGISGVGAAAEKIIAERKRRGSFDTLDEFILRCTIVGVNKGAIESLIKAGALSGIVTNRHQALENLSANVNACRAAIRAVSKKADQTAENMLLDADALYEAINSDGEFKLPVQAICAEYDAVELAQMEKEVAGYYTSGNPLEKYRDVLNRYQHTPIEELAEKNGTEEKIVVVGHISNFLIIHRKSDGAPMCKFTLEDLTGSVESVCFVRQFSRLKTQLSDGAIVTLTGKVEKQEDDNVQFIVQTGRKLA